MRRASLVIPLSIITAYYALIAIAIGATLRVRPDWWQFVPVGGLESLSEPELLTRVTTDDWPFETSGIVGIILAVIGTVILTVPVSWVYLLTSRRKEIEESFVQTIILLPILVTGIALIVQHSIALAFSLAGIVAAVRFRFSLDRPSHALYIFAAIGIGLGAGVASLEISAAMSMLFVYTTLSLWRLDYGEHLGGRFLGVLTGRQTDDDDL